MICTLGVQQLYSTKSSHATVKYLVGILGVIIVLGIVFASRKPNTTDTAQTTSTNTVSIQNFTFAPATLTAPNNTTITWVNNDSVAHTVVVDGTTSPTLQPGESFQHTFVTTGTYDYHCGIHPTMTGQIVIQ